MDKAKTGVAMILAGLVSGALGYGLYGYLREKGRGTWDAGALTGAIGGAIGAVALMLLPDDVLQKYTISPTQQVGGLQFMPTGSTRAVVRWS